MKILLFLFIASSMATAMAADLGKLQESFMARYDEANTKRDTQLKKLEASYLGALTQLENQIKATGDLDMVLPVKGEIDAVRKGTSTLPELLGNRPSRLLEMRKKFGDAKKTLLNGHATELVELVVKMKDILKEQQEELTKAGDVDGALAARRMAETLESDPGIRGAREQLRVFQSSAAGATDDRPLVDFIPGTVWQYESGQIGGNPKKGYLLFFKGGELLSTLPNSGAGTWKVIGDDSIELQVTPYPAVRFEVDKGRRHLNGDDGKSRRRGQLHAGPVLD